MTRIAIVTKAINQATLVDSELAGMKLKVKRLPNIHRSKIQEREGAFDRKNREPHPRQRPDQIPRAHPRSTNTFAKSALGAVKLQIILTGSSFFDAGELFASAPHKPP
jgi:hypothetical protein